MKKTTKKKTGKKTNKKPAKKTPAAPFERLQSKDRRRSGKRPPVAFVDLAVAAEPPARGAVDPERAEAGAEVLEAVFLAEKNFDLESQIVRDGAGVPVAEEDAEGHVWITVKLHVPALDLDTWIDGTHLDHPDNQPDPDGDDDEDDA